MLISKTPPATGIRRRNPPTPHPINHKPQNFQQLQKAKGFKIVHLNTRSILPKIDQLRLALELGRMEVATISETCLREGISTQ